MSNGKKDVIFIRKNGRVIPIRLNKKTKENLKEVGKIGAGVAIGAGTSFTSSLMKSRSVSAGQGFKNAEKAFNEYRLKHGKNHKGVTSMLQTLAKRKAKLAETSKKVQLGGSFIAGSLIGSSLGELVEKNIKDKELREKYDYISDVSGMVLGVATALGSRTRFAKKLLTKTHRAISKHTGLTSKLNRSFIEARKSKRSRKKFAYNPSQQSMF